VQLLGVPTLSSGILMRWQQDGEPQSAVGLALLALLIVALLVGAERNLRRRSRCWNLGNEGNDDQLWSLSGSRRWLGQLLCLLPPLISLGLPLLWMGVSWDQLRSENVLELLALTGRSFSLALLAALLTLLAWPSAGDRQAVDSQPAVCNGSVSWRAWGTPSRAQCWPWR